MESSSMSAPQGARPEHIATDEWSARVRLAACYRIFAHLGWTELIYNHITLRLPGPDRHFLINPFGLHYSEVRASNLVKVNAQGQPVGDTPWPVNPAGISIHTALHAGIADAHCVMHTHTTAGAAVSCLRHGLSMSNFYAFQLHGRLAYHDFEGITLYADEGPRLLASIGDKPAVILRNHGLLSWGRTIAQAFNTLYLLERACQLQLAALPMGPVIVPDEAVQAKCARDSLQLDPAFGAGQDVLDALTRLVCRDDPSYQH